MVSRSVELTKAERRCLISGWFWPIRALEGDQSVVVWVDMVIVNLMCDKKNSKVKEAI